MKRNIEFEIKSDIPYTLPIIKKQARRWFIEFYYNSKRCRYSFDLNRVKNEKEKEKLFLVYRNELEKKLIDGWSPEEPEEQQIPKYLTLEKAFEFAYNKSIKDIRRTTFEVYESYYKKMISCTHFKIIKELPIKEITKRNVVDLLEFCAEENNSSNNTYNRVLRLAKQFFNILIDYEEVEYNVTERIKAKAVDKKRIYTPKDNDVITIKNYIAQRLPNLWDFVFFEFQTGLRPNEITCIKLKMINLDERIIVVPKEFVKTKVDRIVPIDDYIYNWLLKKNIKTFNQEHYLFGQRENRKVNREFTNEDITIAPLMIKRNAITGLWRRIVKEELGINVNLYAFKHLRANKELLINGNLDHAQVLFGHTTSKMTEVYANHKGDIYLDKLRQTTINLNDIARDKVN